MNTLNLKEKQNGNFYLQACKCKFGFSATHSKPVKQNIPRAFHK
jgi:hypothetical protein